MRIIGGRFKRRQLASPTGPGLRPTSDRLRETLFNVLGPGVEGARVLDLFAGTGALGLEALRRGAAAVTFVERDRRALEVLAENVRRCDAGALSTTIAGTFPGAAVPAAAFDLVLLDPPYGFDALEAALSTAAALVAPGGRLVLEHDSRRASPERVEGLERVRLLEAGDSALSFYRHAAPGSPPDPS
jgi:16S rRNA (guanine966-N2)-methyltransferase